MNNEIIAKAGVITKNATDVTIAVIDEYGYPRASTISSIKVEGIETIWFSTALDSGKVRCLSKNNKASVCYHVGADNLTLIGEVDILTDVDTKKQLWVDWFINHFPGGSEDPDYCVLKFKTIRCVYWIDHQQGEFTLAEVKI